MSEAVAKVIAVSTIPAVLLIFLSFVYAVVTNTLDYHGATLGSYFLFGGLSWFIGVWLAVLIYANLPEKKGGKN